MNLLYGLAIIPALILSFLLLGYPLVSGMSRLSSAERMATAMLAGLAWILWGVSVIGSFAPLGSIWILILLIPAGATILHGGIRGEFFNDAKQLLGTPGSRWIGLAVLLFLAALLFPLWSQPGLVFFEGSGNHDNIFWLTGADYLVGHSYLAPRPSDLPDFLFTSINFTGWKPGWGRMGSEGYLALASVFTGRRVIYSYNWSAAALYFPWLAGIFLILKGFIKSRPGLWMLLPAFLLQPVFLFFYANGNLPNLIGALMGATVVIGIHQCLKRESNSNSFCWPFGVLVVFAVHGLICSYPEMAPFVGVTALLLIGAFAFRTESKGRWRRTLEVMIAGVAGFLVNPVSTIRAVNGFMVSFDSARVDQQWGTHSLLKELTPLQYPLYLVTSAGKACADIPPGFAVVLGLLLIVGTVWAIKRSIHPLNTMLLFSGSGLLLLYTLYSGFGYGLQKTVQFSGVIIGAFFPAACLEGLRSGFLKGGQSKKIFSCIAFGLACAFFCYATAGILAYSYRSASRKYITEEMLLQGKKAEHWEILVVSESFRWSYFWTMWANYIFPKSKLTFTTLTREPAGYLANVATWEPRGILSQPRAFFVSEKWAQSMDANSPVISSGAGYALLSKSNRMIEWKGADMEDGSPSLVSLPSELVLVPHQDSVFLLDLDPSKTASGPVRVRVTHQISGGNKTVQERMVGNQWNSDVWVKLKGGVANTITIETVNPGQVAPAPWSLLNYSILNEIPKEETER